MTIQIRLPGPPQGKGRARFAKRGNFAVAYTPEKTRSYEGALRLAAEKAMGDLTPMEGQLRVIVAAHMPIPASWSKKKQEAARLGSLRPITKPDWDNFAKCLDALNGIVWRDDSQVCDGRVIKFYSDQPALVIDVAQAL